MKALLVAGVLCLLWSTTHAGPSDLSVAASDVAQVTGCERCGVILNEIRDVLVERCETVPSPADLRNMPIYLFLSIFDEVSQGGDPVLAERVHNAAILGMACDNPDAGIKDAQQMANRLMLESRI
ncbi:MAG: hypothetical protein V7629_03380 [Motiliproteus sp.]